MEATEETMTAVINDRIRAAILLHADGKPLVDLDDHGPDTFAQFILDNATENDGLNDATHEQVVAMVETIRAEQAAAGADNESTDGGQTIEGQRESFDHIAALVEKLNALDPVNVLKMVAMRDHDAATRRAAVEGLCQVARLDALHVSEAAVRRQAKENGS